MALGEKTVLDLFTKKTDMAGEALKPGAAFSLAHKFTWSDLNTSSDPRGASRGVQRLLIPACLYPGGVRWTGRPG